MILRPIADMLRNLFRSNIQPTSEELAKTAARLEKKILALVGNMSTLPDTAARALAMSRDPNSKFADFARLIEGDPAIATGILRIANSVLYASGCPATRIQQAVVRLGMWQCQNLIVSISMHSLFQKTANMQSQSEALWDHAYVTAFLCRQLNRAYRLGFDGEEFSAGLLHDLGRILLLLADPDCFVRADAMDFLENGDTLERERTAIGIDHCALGGWFGVHSKLPESLIQAMQFHHEPQQTENTSRLVDLVATADHMANHLQRGEDIEAYRAEDNVGLASLWARWPEARRERLLNDLPSVMKESIEAVVREHSVC